MFKDCSYVRALDVSNFDTSSVKNMSHLFSNCIIITHILFLYLIHIKLNMK